MYPDALPTPWILTVVLHWSRSPAGHNGRCSSPETAPKEPVSESIRIKTAGPSLGVVIPRSGYPNTTVKTVGTCPLVRSVTSDILTPTGSESRAVAATRANVAPRAAGLVDIFRRGNTMSTMADTKAKRTRRSFIDEYKTGATGPR